MNSRHFGIDIHKQFMMIAAVDDQQNVVLKPYRISLKAFSKWVEQTLTAHDRVVIEVTTNSWHLYDILIAHAGEVIVANPHKTRLIAEARIKSDKVDALVLAQLLASRFICNVWVPDKALRQWRTLVAHRASLSKQRSRIKNRLHSLLARHGLTCPERSVFSSAGREWFAHISLSPIEKLERRHLLCQLDSINEQRKEAECLMAQLAISDERVPRLMQVL